MEARHNAHGMHFCAFMDLCIFLPLWIILKNFIPSHLCLHICALHRGVRLQTRPSTLIFSLCFESCKTEMLTLICFAEVKAARLEFQIFPASLLHLPLGRQEFTTSSNFTFFHLSSISLGNLIGTLHLCFPRRGCG